MNTYPLTLFNTRRRGGARDGTENTFNEYPFYILNTFLYYCFSFQYFIFHVSILIMFDISEFQVTPISYSDFMFTMDWIQNESMTSLVIDFKIMFLHWKKIIFMLSSSVGGSKFFFFRREIKLHNLVIVIDILSWSVGGFAKSLIVFKILYAKSVRESVSFWVSFIK